MRIAICDDDAADLAAEYEIIGSVLDEKGVAYTFDRFSDPAELLAADRFDIAFLDVEMDGMTGIELARLSSGIDSAIERIEAANKKIIVTNFKNKLKTDIAVSDIIYISNSGRRAKITAVQCEFETEEIFSEIKDMIESEVNYFAMPHQSFYVNLKYVTGYNKTDVTMSYAGRTYKVFMTRRRYKDFDARFFELAKDLR